MSLPIRIRIRHRLVVRIAGSLVGFLLVVSTSTVPPRVEAFSVQQQQQQQSQPPSTTPLSSRPILGPSTEKEWFDFGCVANPVVLPPLLDKEDALWQCFYYGNGGSWNQGHPCFLPTGSTGRATSPDGISHWTKQRTTTRPGAGTDGSVLGPSSEGGSWDSVQTGVGDVVRLPNGGDWHMYYFGGSDEALPMGPPPGNTIVGFRMRIGRAISKDQGQTWVKDPKGYLLDYDESEGLFASWPRIIVNEKGLPWKMLYHSFNGSQWRVFGAESNDGGDSWTRTGLVLQGGTSDQDFDHVGIGTRTVTPWRNGFLMIYEGVDVSSKHRLGAAYCEDLDNGEWIKLNDGLAILEPGQGPLGEWTKQVIGTPYVLSMPDGSLRLYHCGKDGPDGKMAIGVLESKTGDITPESWTVLPSQ